MEQVEKSIEVSAPLKMVYNQWTQFEEFPKFMEGVEAVHQVDDKHLHWVAEIGGKRKEWDAEIVEQIPDERIAWRSTSGAPNFGVVHFKPRDPDHTVVTIRLNYEPESAFEKAGALFGVVGHRVESDLKHFREFIEQRSTQTGAWRGEIHATDTANQERSQILREATPRSGTSGYGSSGQSGLT